jgi:hypothetical protein
MFFSRIVAPSATPPPMMQQQTMQASLPYTSNYASSAVHTGSTPSYAGSQYNGNSYESDSQSNYGTRDYDIRRYASQGYQSRISSELSRKSSLSVLKNDK